MSSEAPAKGKKASTKKPPSVETKGASEPQGDPAADAVAHWLNTTGFAVEAETAKQLHKHGYFQVEAPAHYADLDGKTVKELDVLAWRTEDAKRLWDDPRIKDLMQCYSEDSLAKAFKQAVTVTLRIECKYAVQPWVLFSATTEHATQAPMTENFMATKRAAKLLEALPKVNPSRLPLLFNGGIVGRSLRQAKTGTDGKPASNTDDCYKAIMSALVSSQYAVTQPRGIDDPLEVTIPAIVIKGQPLFNAATDAAFDLAHKRVGRARLLYKLPNDMAKDFAVDVVHLDSLGEYIEAAAQTAEGIIQASADLVYRQLYQKALDADNKKWNTPARSSFWGS